MWQDFMRGNWPAVASTDTDLDSPAYRQPVAETAPTRAHRHAADRSAGAEARAQARPRRSRRLAAKLAVVPGTT